MRLLALLIALLASGSPGPAGAASRERPKRVYAVSEARGFVHPSIPDAVAELGRLGRASPRYDVIPLRAGAAGLTARRLRSADAVVFANTTGELPLPDRAAFLRFVRDGGGFLGVHAAADTFHSWPGYTRMLGAEFKRHPDQQTGRLVVEAPRDPAMRGVPSSFRLRDEFYEFVSSPRRRAKVLLSLDPRSIRGAQGPDHPLVWKRRYGRGRVFYDGLGHFPETWRDARQRRIVAAGLSWVLGLG